MAGLVVVDTDLIIDFLRGKGPGVALVRELIADGRMRVTAVTAFEIRVGADLLTRRDDILHLLGSRTFPMDLGSALQAAEIAAGLQREGRGIGLADCMQAGICLRYELPLATRNRRHFERVDGLQLVDIS